MSTLTLPKWPTMAEIPSQFGALEYDRDGRPSERWERRALHTIMVPYAFRLAWQPNRIIRHVTCHRNVSKSLVTCLSELLALYGSPQAVSEEGLDLFGGCYEFRHQGWQLSPHAYGMAIEIDPEHNPPGKKWEDGKGMMPQEAVEIFEGNGWSWGGRAKRPECATFSAVSP